MAAQAENRFRYSCGEYFEDSDRFCAKCGCKRESLHDSPVGQRNQNLQMSMCKKRVMKEVALSKLNFTLVRTTVKALKKVVSLQTDDPKF